MSPCPPESSLQDLMDGRLSGDDRSALLRHLDECEACRLLVVAIAPADSEGRASTHPGHALSSPGPPGQEFAAGTAVDRYRILRHLGAGGMGMVYAALDVKLGRQVALKVLHREASRGDAAEELRARLFREAQVMARLAHPNVVAVHDVGTYGEQVYLVMEMMEGGSLREWLEEQPRAWDAVVEAFRAAGLGLQAAHEAGLVHRDFKPDNVLVDRAGRIKVGDFGLAQVEGGAADEAPLPDSPAVGQRLTRTGALMGTPGYMAPEQIRGEGVDLRADIFSFCAALYEALYGQRPFSGDTLKALHQDILAGRIREVTGRSRVPTRVREALLRGLRADPAARYQTMGALIDALGPESPRRIAGRGAAAAAAGLAVLLSAGAAYLGFRWRALPTHERGGGHVTSQAIRKVAVLGFSNLSGGRDQAWISTALAEMLTGELGAGEGLLPIQRSLVGRVIRDLGLAEGEVLGGEQLRRARRYLGAELLVHGALLRAASGGRIRLDARLQDAASGDVLFQVGADGSEDALPDLALRVGRRLRERLGVALSTTLPEQRLSLPADPEVVRLYADAVHRLEAYDFAGSVELLEQVVRRAPKNPLLRYQLADARLALGQVDGAREDLGQAVALAGGLRKQDRLMIEGRHHELSGALDKAVESFQTLFEFFPENQAYGHRVAQLLWKSGKSRAALERIGHIRRIRGAEEDPGIDLLEQACLRDLGDMAGALRAVNDALRKAKDMGARSMVMISLKDRAWIQTTQGDLRGAEEGLSEARQLALAIGHRPYLGNVLSGLSHVHCRLGELSQSRDEAGEALSIHQRQGDHWEEAVDRVRLADRQLRLGDLAGAQKALERPWPGQPAEYDAVRRMRLGGVLLALGQLPEARRLEEQVLAEGKKEPDGSGAAEAAQRLGQVLASLGDSLGARRNYERALQVYQKASAHLDVADAQVLLAALSLDEGQAQEAERRAGEAAATFGRSGARDDEALALAVLARARRILGHPADELLARVRELGRRSESPRVRAQVAIAWAQVQPESEEALAELQRAVAEVRRCGLAQEELAARLAVAELAKGPARRALLLALAGEARRRGFLAVADLALGKGALQRARLP